MWAMTRPRKFGNNENKRNRSNTTQIALQQLSTAVGESAIMHFRPLTNSTRYRSRKSQWLRVDVYLIPAFNQIQQERPRKLFFSRQEHQMVAMNFNRGRSQMLVRIASHPDQKSPIRHETVFA
jgi:hypothetical protein